MSTRIARDPALFPVVIENAATESKGVQVTWAAGGLVYFGADWDGGAVTLEMLTPAGVWAGIKDSTGATVGMTAAAGTWEEIPPVGMLGHTVRFKHGVVAAARTLYVALKG